MGNETKPLFAGRGGTVKGIFTHIVSVAEIKVFQIVHE